MLPVTKTKPSPCLLLVDGHAYAYRSFYAIRHLNAPDGTPTNAIFGFIKAIKKMRERCRPTHIVVMWDGGLDEMRMEELPDYKSNRDPMPDDLETQLDLIVEWLEATGIKSICEEGREADDGIATLVRRAENAGLPIVIASADKDFFQLIKPGIAMLNPNDKTETLWTGSEVRAKTGVNPDQIVDWLSLVGDAVDEIPGVPGVGAKTAANLLNQFGSIESMYSQLDEIKSERIKKLLVGMSDNLARNQRLVKLLEDLPIECSIDDMLVGEEKHDLLEKLFTRWNFRTQLQELESERQQKLI